MRLLRRLFPFWALNLSFIVLAATGLYTHYYPRFYDLSWGLVEMAHVFIGWVALPVMIGYQVHHLKAKWTDLSEFWQWTGLKLTSITVIAFGTGVLLELRIAGGLPQIVTTTHFVSTFIVFGVLVVHTFRVWRAWLRARFRRFFGRSADRAGTVKEPSPEPAGPALPDDEGVGDEEADEDPGGVPVDGEGPGGGAAAHADAEQGPGDEEQDGNDGEEES